MNERTTQKYEDYYDIIKVIGNGAFGCVYKGKEKNKNELRAIKVMDLDKIKENLLNNYDVEDLKEHLKLNIEGFIKEFENMKICSINNNNSVKCYEYFINEEYFVIIMEYCDKDLSKLLMQKISGNEKGFSSEEILEIMKQLNNALKIMKQNNIVHRDLKLENILIKYNDREHKNFTIKLTDYGSSKRLTSLSKNYCKTNTGTTIYMAPEILKGEEYNYKCDLWSIGIIIYRLFFGKSPFHGESEEALIKNIEKFGNKLIKKTGNEELDDLIQKLLEKEPSKRLDWDNYLNHPFFKEYRKKINIIYEIEEDRIENIFGEKFVRNNENKIELILFKYFKIISSHNFPLKKIIHFFHFWEDYFYEYFNSKWKKK